MWSSCFKVLHKGGFTCPGRLNAAGFVKAKPASYLIERQHSHRSQLCFSTRSGSLWTTGGSASSRGDNGNEEGTGDDARQQSSRPGGANKDRSEGQRQWASGGKTAGSKERPWTSRGQSSEDNSRFRKGSAGRSGGSASESGRGQWAPGRQGSPKRPRGEQQDGHLRSRQGVKGVPSLTTQEEEWDGGPVKRARPASRDIEAAYDGDDEDNSASSYEGEDWEDSQGEGSSGKGGRFLYPERRSLKGDLIGETVLYGVAPVLCALRQQRRKMHVLYVQETMDMKKRKDASAVRESLELAAQCGAQVKRMPKHDLNMLAGNRPHQGLLLDCGDLPWQTLNTLPTAEDAMAAVGPSGRPPVWLALDEVMDPQNLGAMVRSAYCLGASGVLACARNCAPLSGTVSKASAGVLEAWQLHSCSNMMRTLTAAAEAGWEVLGAEAGPAAKPVTAVVLNKPTILVLGNEGYGLRPNVRRCCTGLVRVDMVPGPRDALVDSLNVSVATGILLHQLLSSRTEAAAAAAGPDNALPETPAVIDA